MIYTIPVGTSSVTFGSVLFEVKTAQGATYVNGAAASFAIEQINGTAAAYSTVAAGAGLAMSASWGTYQAGITSSTGLTSLYSIVVDMGTTSSTTGQGYTIIALGTGSYGDATSPTSLP